MKTSTAALVLLGCLIAVPAGASDVGYLYGRVTTVDGDSYTGQLRWGDEEAFWDDIFNSNKIENENLDYLDRDELDEVRDRKRNPFSFLWDDDDEFTHLFAVRFGDMSRIDVHRRGEITVEFRNGEHLELEGGSNDVQEPVTVVDAKAGVVQVRWKRIRQIEFMPTPAKLEHKLGEPLYGTVRSSEGEFTGLIQWDHHECLSTDELDGDTRDGDMSLEFGNIRSIRKHRRGSMVTLASGTEIYLTGSNDVDSDNRGIVVKDPSFGRVLIGWRDFEEITFQTPAPTSGPGYEHYASAHAISGTVHARGASYDGRIVYDLDEAWDFEMLHGSSGDTEYLIPFREIARIAPHGSRRAEVQLRSGRTISLEESQDVSRRNDGVLIFTDSRRPTYVSWRDVDEIVFR